MLPIQKMLINYNFSARNNKISYICIHDVGEPSSAKNNRDYFAGGNRNASVDFFVDSNNIIQIIDYIKNYSWAIGDGKGKYGITNSNSISIEMCLEKDYQPSEQTVKNTLELTRYLMKELNIPIDRVITHNMATDKICPKSFSANNWAKWTEFKSKLVPTPVINPVVNKAVLSEPVVTVIKFRKTCTVFAEKLNCRTAPINGSIIKQFSKGDKLTFVDYNTDKTWGLLTFGDSIGWISLAYVNDIKDVIETPVLTPQEIADAKLGIKFRKECIVTATLLNCRTSPISGSVIKQFKLNDKLTFVDYNEDKTWGKLLIGDEIGWISLQYVKLL